MAAIGFIYAWQKLYPVLIFRSVVQVLAAAKMECLHGKPASCSTTKKGSFWFCGQKVVDLFVHRMKAMPFKELSKRGGTQISNS